MSSSVDRSVRLFTVTAWSNISIYRGLIAVPKHRETTERMICVTIGRLKWDQAAGVHLLNL